MNLEENKVTEENYEGPIVQQNLDKPSLFARLRTSIVSGTSKGVTLIELLAVIAILAVIAAVAIPVVQNSINNAKVNTTKQNLQIISSALQNYAASHNGTYPTTSGWVDASSSSSSGSSSSSSSSSSTLMSNLSEYIKAIPQDGWNTDFVYESTNSGAGYELATAASAANASPGQTVVKASSGDQEYYITDTMGQPQKGPAQ